MAIQGMAITKNVATLLPLFLLFTNFSVLLISATNENHAINPIPGPPQPPPPPPKPRISPFRHSIEVIVGVLTIIFLITFLLLFYTKHCKRTSHDFSIGSSRGYEPSKDSGVERAVVESLPLFRFESLRGQKDGLECAVCLNRFESEEFLRLLPKCKHGFHVECVDTWLLAHSTCPLCRQRINSGDFSFSEEVRVFLPDEEVSAAPAMESSPKEVVVGSSRVSGRHSFAGSLPGVIVEAARIQRPPPPLAGRRSLDSRILRKKTNSEMVIVGCFARPSKDERLVIRTGSTPREQRRLEHRIIVSKGVEGEEHEEETLNHRWSDVQPSDLLFLRSEMILRSSGESDKDLSKERSVSEIRGFSRVMSDEQRRKLHAGAVSRWSDWISVAQPHQIQQPTLSQSHFHISP